LSDEMKADAALVIKLVDQIRPLLAGHHPRVQGAVCCELTAYWVAGHVVEGVDPVPLMNMHVIHVMNSVAELVREFKEEDTR
jgi:hypothetical protein